MSFFSITQVSYSIFLALIYVAEDRYDLTSADKRSGGVNVSINFPL